VRSLVSPEFRKLFDQLPAEIRGQARKAYATWPKNADHPGLDFKKLKVTDAYSARVGLHYRAICVKVGDDQFVWEWIGTHADYDKLLRNM
jgi:hypothetical protein